MLISLNVNVWQPLPGRVNDTAAVKSMFHNAKCRSSSVHEDSRGVHFSSQLGNALMRNLQNDTEPIICLEVNALKFDWLLYSVIRF